MKRKSAVIIKGNPKFITGNTVADQFYQDIKCFLENLDYEVTFDAGEPHTSPPNADLWIGHSRGVDRLQFAPKGTITVMFGTSRVGAVNHPDDNSQTGVYPSEVMPNKFHYVFNDEMKQAIIAATRKNS
jgi:hypothetical protein